MQDLKDNSGRVIATFRTSGSVIEMYDGRNGFFLGKFDGSNTYAPNGFKVGSGNQLGRLVR